MAAHDGKLQLLLAGIGNGTGRFLRDAVRIPEGDPPFQKQAQTGPHGVGAGLHDDEVTFGDGLEFVRSHEGCAILVDEEFSCLEFDMNRDTISWIWRKNRIQEVAYGTLTEENLSKRHQLYAGR